MSRLRCSRLSQGSCECHLGGMFRSPASLRLSQTYLDSGLRPGHVHTDRPSFRAIVPFKTAGAQDRVIHTNIISSKIDLGKKSMYFRSRTFVPESWMRKKQTSVSYSSTESEVISSDAGPRMDGFNSLSHPNPLHKIMPMLHAMEVRDARAAVNNECGGSGSGRWSFSFGVPKN